MSTGDPRPAGWTASGTIRQQCTDEKTHGEHEWYDGNLFRRQCEGYVGRAGVHAGSTPVSEEPARPTRMHWHPCNSSRGCASIGDDLDAAYARGISEGRQEVDSLKQRIAEYENAITWNVACFGCAKQLDGLIAERERGYEEGFAEGRRQATEGWSREWGGPNGGEMQYRLVGRWEPAEQPEGGTR